MQFSSFTTSKIDSNTIYLYFEILHKAAHYRLHTYNR